jgi:hypothetical protein
MAFEENVQEVVGSDRSSARETINLLVKALSFFLLF